MDKLEKALEKARQQRARRMPDPAATVVPVTMPPLETLAQGDAAAAMLDESTLARRRIVAHRTGNAEADRFRLLRAQTLQVMGKAGLRSLCVTSPNYGDGKTTIAINLAISMALDLKQTVLLADLDLRKPCIDSYLGLQPRFGLSDYFAGRAPVSGCLIRLPFERLVTLPAGQPVKHSSEVLGSPQMQALARELKARYPDRMIVYDMPPLLAQDDPLAFLPHVDAVLLVVQDGVTRADAVRRCLDILAPATVVGTVLNQTR